MQARRGSDSFAVALRSTVRSWMQENARQQQQEIAERNESLVLQTTNGQQLEPAVGSVPLDDGFVREPSVVLASLPDEKTAFQAASMLVPVESVVQATILR